MNRLFVSAAHKSSGKTTLCIGLAAALAARGEAVQTFKKGPDYIDPLWLGRAAGRPCYTLDPYLCAADDAGARLGQAQRAEHTVFLPGQKRGDFRIFFKIFREDQAQQPVRVADAFRQQLNDDI